MAGGRRLRPGRRLAGQAASTGRAILSGGAGLATSLIFVWFSAPDLALTQLTVEVVTAVLILLGLRWLPRRDASYAQGPESARVHLRRLRDLLLAITCGLGLAGVTYAVLSRPGVAGISSFSPSNPCPWAAA